VVLNKEQYGVFSNYRVFRWEMEDKRVCRSTSHSKN